MEKNIIAIIVGITLVFVAYLIAFKEKINLIHKYHYANVRKEDIKAYEKATGFSIFVIAIGVLSMPLLNMSLNEKLGNIIGLGFVIIGIVLLSYSSFKYNGGIFSKHEKNNSKF